MPSTKLRRSKRIAARAKDSVDEESDLAGSKRVAAKPMPSQQPRRSKRIIAKEEAATDEESDYAATSKRVATKTKTKRRARSRATSCSLQSLAAPTAPEPRSSKKKKASPSTRTPSLYARCVTLTPAAKSPGTADTKSKVTFDLERNCLAEYEKGNPPSVVKRLPFSPDVRGSARAVPAVDETTRRNAEVLSAWDDYFDDFNFSASNE